MSAALLLVAIAAGAIVATRGYRDRVPALPLREYPRSPEIAERMDAARAYCAANGLEPCFVTYGPASYEARQQAALLERLERESAHAAYVREVSEKTRAKFGWNGPRVVSR